jgi:hypothetical protein
MSETLRHLQARTLGFSAIAEAVTGLAALAAPALVASLLLGAELSAVGIAVVRCFGVALLGLGIACWPGVHGHAPFRALLTYNALIALYLAYVGTAGQMDGLLLWPAVGLHAAVALLLVWTRSEK